MPSNVARLRRLLGDREGGAAIEYGIAAGIIAVGIASAFTTLSDRLQNALNSLNF